jgi:phosphate-selective porin OprO/OprP
VPTAAFEPVAPAPAPLAAAAPAPAAAAPAEEENDLLPPGEKEKVAPREVSKGIKFTPGEGIKIESADKDFSVGLSLRFQLLYTLNDDDPVTKDTAHSLQLRRTRLLIGGNLFGVHNKYKVELGFSPSDVAMTQTAVGTSPLLEAYAELDYLRDLTVRAGQYKVPYDRIRVTSDFARQLVDYAPAVGEFNLDRDLGVEIKSNDLFGLGMLRYHLGLFSGKGRNSFAPQDTGLMYVARAEFLPLGLFDDYPESDFQRTKPRLAIGVGYAHLEDARRDKGTTGAVPADGGSTDMNNVEGDVVFKACGFSLLSGIYYRHGDRNPGSATDEMGNPIAAAPTRDGWGFTGQAGYLLPRMPVEIAARYSNIRGRTVAGHDGLKDSNELGGGVSYYFAQHPLKLQADYFRVFADDFSAGYNQVRLQLQVVL